MKIIVCIKQVPGTSKVEVDPKTGILKRDGVESKMNPYDLYALEAALKIKEKIGGVITVITMGPPQAKEVIRESYMMGADEGYLLSDMKFAGADVLATSGTLSQGIRITGDFDLIICGKQTTDGDTAQVGPAVAEYLGIPHVTWVRTVSYVDEKKIVVEQDMEDSIVTAEMNYPCLITVEKGAMQPRLPSYRKKLATENRPVSILSLKDFADQDEKKYGIDGSSTQVERIFPPGINTTRVLWEGGTNELVGNAFKKLKDMKFIKG